jgi:hypothetical protein
LINQHGVWQQQYLSLQVKQPSQLKERKHWNKETMKNNCESKPFVGEAIVVACFEIVPGISFIETCVLLMLGEVGVIAKSVFTVLFVSCVLEGDEFIEFEVFESGVFETVILESDSFDFCFFLVVALLVGMFVFFFVGSDVVVLGVDLCKVGGLDFSELGELGEGLSEEWSVFCDACWGELDESTVSGEWDVLVIWFVLFVVSLKSWLSGWEIFCVFFIIY